MSKALLAAICCLPSVSGISLQLAQDRYAVPLGSDGVPSAFWSCKNGDLQRTGATLKVGPKSLQKPSWTWQDPNGYGAIESTPVIDAEYNSFIATTAGGTFGISRNGTVLWSRQLPGRAMTPALLDGVLYAATNKGKAFALNSKTGDVIWEAQVHEDAGGDAWSLTVAMGVLLVPGKDAHEAGGNHEIKGVSIKDGSVLWTFKPPHYVYNFMPVVLGNTFLFMDVTGGVGRANLHTGEMLWHTPATLESSSTGGLILGPHNLIFATSNSQAKQGLVHAHRAQDGKLVWVKHFETEAAAAPAVYSGGRGAIIVGLGYNCGDDPTPRNHTGRVVSLDALTGQERWHFNADSYFGGLAKGAAIGPVLHADHMEAVSLPDTWSNPAVGGDGTVYVGWHGGILYALKGESGEKISNYDVGYSFQGEPAIAPGYLVVASIYKVIAFDTSM